MSYYFPVKRRFVRLPTVGIKDVGNVKVAFDLSLVILAVITSWFFLGEIVGVREGTAIAAFCCGFIVRLFYKPLHCAEEQFLRHTVRFLND